MIALSYGAMVQDAKNLRIPNHLREHQTLRTINLLICPISLYHILPFPQSHIFDPGDVEAEKQPQIAQMSQIGFVKSVQSVALEFRADSCGSVY